MQVYSIIGDAPRPQLSFVGFTGNTHQFLQAEEHGDGQVALLRAVHLNINCISALFGHTLPDGSVELYLFTKQGQSAETSTNTMHHHVTALTKDARAYATKLGTSRFYMRTSTRQSNFFSNRFSEWESHTVDNVAHATLEVV